MFEEERVIGNEFDERRRPNQSEPFFPGKRQIGTTSNGFRDGNGGFRDEQFVQKVTASGNAAPNFAKRFGLAMMQFMECPESLLRY
jgi:hypothetical protein